MTTILDFWLVVCYTMYSWVLILNSSFHHLSSLSRIFMFLSHTQSNEYVLHALTHMQTDGDTHGALEIYMQILSLITCQIDGHTCNGMRLTEIL